MFLFYNFNLLSVFVTFVTNFEFIIGVYIQFCNSLSLYNLLTNIISLAHLMIPKLSSSCVKNKNHFNIITLKKNLLIYYTLFIITLESEFAFVSKATKFHFEFMDLFFQCLLQLSTSSKLQLLLPLTFCCETSLKD